MSTADLLKQYIGVLLNPRFPQPPGVREVAEHATSMTNGQQRLEYLERVISQNPVSTRVSEVASELRAAFTGAWDQEWPES